MKAAMIFTGSGPIVVLTSHDSLTDASLIEKFNAKGITRFIAYEIPVALAEERYGGHYKVVVNDLHESDDLRVLDFNGNRAFGLFKISELGKQITFEG